MTARPLPAHPEAETCVIGAAMMDGDAYTTAAAMLRDEHFGDEKHRAIWRALAVLRADGEAFDPVTLADVLQRSGDLERAGGKDYVGFLVDAVPTAANVSYHARIVREYAERRELIRLARRIEAEAFVGQVKPKDIAASLSSELVAVAAVTGSRGFRPAKDLLWPAMEGIEARASGKVTPGVRTGYAAIDEHLGGFRPGELCILAGVPSSGKTALACNVLLNAAAAGDACALVSAEMTANAIIERALGNWGLVESGALRRGTLEDSDYGRLVAAAGKLTALPLWIDDTARPAIADICARLRHLKAQHPALALAVVDFIQLIRYAGDDAMALALMNISYDLKGIAKELGIAVIATCQVDAAAVEKSETPRPRLHHLRWSQGMREAADFAALVYRPAMYDLSVDRERMEIMFEKARELPPFTAVLRWIGKYMRVERHPDFPTALAA